MAPRLTLLLPIATLAAAGWFGGRAYVLLGALLWLAVFSSGPGWRWIRLMTVIADARRAERAAPMAPSWETPRA